jgi:hypothetical protein
LIDVPPVLGPESGDTVETSGGVARFSSVTVGGVVQHRGWKMKAPLTSAVPLTVRGGCPLAWIVAVYVAALALTSTPATLKLPPPHSSPPPEYGDGLVTVPWMLVVCELIVNGIESFSVFDGIRSFIETLAFALVSANVPG